MFWHWIISVASRQNNLLWGETFASLSDNTHSKNSGGSASPSVDSSYKMQQNNV